MIFASALFVGTPTIDLITVDSTNDYASALLSKQQISDGLVVCARRQTKGKGQMGARWLTKEGKNLTLSIILKPKSLHIKHQFYLSIISSLSIRDLLAKYHISAAVKWPNDIYVNHNKIAGILIQNSLIKSTIQHSIVGIGINVNQENFDVSIPNPTSLRLETNELHDLLKIREELYASFESYYIDLKEERFDSLLGAYTDHLYQRDVVRSFRLADGSIVQGIIRGVEENGLLKVEIDDQIRRFSLKEIGFVGMVIG